MIHDFMPFAPSKESIASEHDKMRLARARAFDSYFSAIELDTLERKARRLAMLPPEIRSMVLRFSAEDDAKSAKIASALERSVSLRVAHVLGSIGVGLEET